jgi:hypothetical protein
VGSVALRENYGFSARELALIESELEENIASLLSAWEGIHGIR